MQKSIVTDIRYIHPEPGMVGNIHYHDGWGPEAWPEGKSIKVVKVNSTGVLVKDTAGRQTEIAPYCLNMGREYEIDGVWLPENHPLVLNYLAICLAHEQETTYPASGQPQMITYKHMLEEILATHGWLPATPSPIRQMQTA
ncbi:MAG: hypothetical protein ABIT76_04295 [Chthoniobacterales bacterium]